MTDEKTRQRVTALLSSGVRRALEAHQVATLNPQGARDVAKLALLSLRRAAEESQYLETLEERQASGIISGPLAATLRASFGYDLD